MKITQPLALAFAALLVTSATAAADDRVTDLYFQEAIERYFEYPQNAATFGMAGSNVMTTSDSSSVVGNPAGLGFMKLGEVSGTYSHNSIGGAEFDSDQSVTQQTNAGSGMIAIPLGGRSTELPDYGNLGIAWTQSYGRWGDSTYDTIAKRMQIVGAYSLPINSNLSAGYSLGWTDDKFQAREVFDFPMASGFRHTLGLQWQDDQGDLRIGFSGMLGHGRHHALFEPDTNATSKTFETGADLGASYRVASATVLAMGLEYRHLQSNGDVVESIPANVVGGDENGNVYGIKLGVEQGLFDNAVKIRAGYRYAGLAAYNYNRVELNDINGSAYYNAWTLGAGYEQRLDSKWIPSIRIDYGVEYRTTSGDDWEHVVTVSMPFDLCPPA